MAKHLARTSVMTGAVLAVLAATALADAPAEPASVPDEMLAGLGAETYQQYCASCHGETGLGDGPVGGTLRTRPADLTRIAQRRGGRFPDAEIARIIDGRFESPAHGTREMPIWGRKLGEPIGDAGTADEVVRGRILILVEYLKTIQASSASEDR